MPGIPDGGILDSIEYDKVQIKRFWMGWNWEMLLQEVWTYREITPLRFPQNFKYLTSSHGHFGKLGSFWPWL